MNRAMTGISQFFGGALSGGIGSSMAGGKFWDGVRQGVITGVLNHAAHLLTGGDEPPKIGDTYRHDLPGGGYMEFRYDGKGWSMINMQPSSGAIESVDSPIDYLIGGKAISSSISLGGRSVFNFIVKNPKIFNKNNWLRLGWGNDGPEKFFRISIGAHEKYFNEVPKILQPLNKWLRSWGKKGHFDFRNIKP